MTGANGCRGVLLYRMVSSGPAPCSGFGDAELAQSQFPRYSGANICPIPKAKGTMRNRLKVYYWVSEWKMLWGKEEQKLRPITHMRKPRGKLSNATRI